MRQPDLENLDGLVYRPNGKSDFVMLSGYGTVARKFWRRAQGFAKEKKRPAAAQPFFAEHSKYRNLVKAQSAQTSDRIILNYVHDPREEIRPFHKVIREDRYELHIPLNHGNATVTSDGKLLHKGAVFPGLMRLASPGEEVRGFFFSTVEFVMLSIPGPRLRATLQALDPAHQPGKVCFVNALQQPQFQVEQLGRLLLHAEQLDAVHAQLFTDGVADSLLACLLSHHRGKRLERGDTKALAPDEFQRVIDFAEAQLEDTLCLKEWAAVLEMSTPAFTRRFRATTGCSPYVWFMQRRIDRSKELLRSTQRTLCDVALSVGFCSQSHFTEAFRRREGTSPARWREAHGIRG